MVKLIRPAFPIYELAIFALVLDMAVFALLELRIGMQPKTTIDSLAEISMAC